MLHLAKLLKTSVEEGGDSRVQRTARLSAAQQDGQIKLHATCNFDMCAIAFMATSCHFKHIVGLAHFILFHGPVWR